MKKHKPQSSFTLSLDLEDEKSPIVLITQDDEATIYLKLKDVARLLRELNKMLKKLEQ